MGLFLIIGIFCVLAVIGFFVTGRPFGFAIGGIVFLTALSFVSLITIAIWAFNFPCSAPFTDHNSTYCQNKTGSTTAYNSKQSNFFQQTPETSSDSFPMNDGTNQYSWYNNHNVAMAYRCYPGGSCSAQEWALAVYGNKNDSRGIDLKQQADKVYLTYKSQFPSEKCVNESGIKICDLSFNVVATHPAGTRTVKMDANKIGCVDVATGEKISSDFNQIIVDSGNTFCATDGGNIYIDSTLKASKYFGMISKNDGYVNYTLPFTYNTCIWTYNGGSGNFPYLDIMGSDGPNGDFFNVKAFCKNGNNQIDIFSYKSN